MVIVETRIPCRQKTCFKHTAESSALIRSRRVKTVVNEKRKRRDPSSWMLSYITGRKENNNSNRLSTPGLSVSCGCWTELAWEIRLTVAVFWKGRCVWYKIDRLDRSETNVEGKDGWRAKTCWRWRTKRSVSMIRVCSATYGKDETFLH